MTPIERQWHIIERLEARRFDTMQHLAEECGVTWGTIYNDINQLSLVFPIWTAKGKHGGVHIADDFHLSNKHLTMEQRTALIEIMEFLSEEKREIIKSILLDFSCT